MGQYPKNAAFLFIRPKNCLSDLVDLSDGKKAHCPMGAHSISKGLEAAWSSRRHGAENQEMKILLCFC